jgi:hypothetical protein
LALKLRESLPLFLGACGDDAGPTLWLATVIEQKFEIDGLLRARFAGGWLSVAGHERGLPVIPSDNEFVGRRPIGAAAFATARNLYVRVFLHALKPVRELYFRRRAHRPAELTGGSARLCCRSVIGNKGQRLSILRWSHRRHRALAHSFEGMRHVVVSPAHRQMCKRS